MSDAAEVRTIGEVFEIPVELVDIADRIRIVNQDKARGIAASMTDAGQTTPIEVRRTKGGRYKLVTGAHRVYACGLLGRPVQAVLFEGSDDDAELREVDENLYRADLTAAEQTLFIDKRVKLYRYAGGELRKGRDARKSANLADYESPRFYSDLSKKFGIARRTAERCVRRSRNISRALWEKIAESRLDDSASTLDRISIIEAEQPGTLLMIMERDGCGLKAAIAACREPAERDKTDALLARFRKLLVQAAPSELDEMKRLLDARIKEVRS
jgi:ParB family transcriptional regulator, chromosome partitioning protein